MLTYSFVCSIYTYNSFCSLHIVFFCLLIFFCLFARSFHPASLTHIRARARHRYTRAVRSGGALLICVVGAKLSEGINFADELARCVVVAGLPFANVGDVEINARMEYVARMNPGDPGAARRYYEDLCLKAVNQSIGRAIRHRGDYAALLLVDRRYATPRIAAKLPTWIRERTRNARSFGEVQQQLAAFFRARAASKPET